MTARLTEANLASKSDMANFVKRTNLNKIELNKLSKKVKAISTKGLTKDLMNGYKILNPIQDGLFRGCSRMGDLALPP